MRNLPYGTSYPCLMKTITFLMMFVLFISQPTLLLLMMTKLAISDTSNRRDVSFDAKYALRHKLSLSDKNNFYGCVHFYSLSVAQSLILQKQELKFLQNDVAQKKSQ